eukprot:TRINITY_DN103937_c0_g1_i1.p1 TRINITY_DN103937_c0_g1~~TRINITY_DN103937_c0_g1_i1.p1  ORF type:complete len:341 (+),score=61.13 TRINITY_DN103937_c0_g1_i1:96-1118(+)
MDDDEWPDIGNFHYFSSYHKLTDYLFLGNEDAARDKASLKKAGVTHILNVADNVDCFHPNDFTYLHCQIEDGGYDSAIVDAFAIASDFIASAKHKGCKVLIHCFMGINRSATVAIASQMIIEGWTLLEAYKHTKKCRACVSLFQGNREKIARWEQQTRGTCTMPEWLGTVSLRSEAASKGEVALGADSVRAVFAYGTLRGDCEEDGDRWGVIKETDASWQRATVRGYRLYQEKHLPYPFAVHTGREEDVLVGTLLQWPSTKRAEDGLRRCNRIEGFNPARPTAGWYLRAEVEAELPDDCGTFPAFIYHKRLQANADVLFFPSGNWFDKHEEEDAGTDGAK